MSWPATGGPEKKRSGVRRWALGNAAGRPVGRRRVAGGGGEGRSRSEGGGPAAREPSGGDGRDGAGKRLRERAGDGRRGARPRRTPDPRRPRRHRGETEFARPERYGR